MLSADWSPDGTRVLFSSNRKGNWDIYSQAVDGSTPAQVVVEQPYDQILLSVAPDGTFLYRELQPKTGSDLWVRTPDGKVNPVRVTPYNERSGVFSPGASPKWIAYASDESGRFEVYVQSYPGGANRMAISNGGGDSPRWSPDGKQLFYVSGGAMMSMAVHPDGTFGVSRKLFDVSSYLKGIYSSYDVSPDGKRFLMIHRDEGSVPRQLNVILNWFAELDRMVPLGKYIPWRLAGSRALPSRVWLD